MCQYAFFAVPKHAARHVQITALKPDARAIAVGHAHIFKNQTINRCFPSPQHKGRLAFAYASVENRTPRLDRPIAYAALLLNGAVAIAAGCDQYCAFAIAYRFYRRGEMRKCASAFRYGERWCGCACVRYRRKSDTARKLEQMPRNLLHNVNNAQFGVRTSILRLWPEMSQRGRPKAVTPHNGTLTIQFVPLMERKIVNAVG